MNFPRVYRNIVTQLLIFALLVTQLFGAHATMGAQAIERYAIVALLVEESLWADSSDYLGLSAEKGGVSPATLKYRIERYARSIQQSLPLTKVNILITGKNEETPKIAQLLEKLYREGDGAAGEINSLAGIVLIGDLPIPVVKKGDNRFPSMYPYTDFDDKLYIFNEISRDFELSDNVKNPQAEIWHGVIQPPKMGAEGSEMLARYFDKNQLYRNGDEKYSSFDKELFYGDLSRETLSLNSDNFGKNNNLSELAYDKVYFTGNKELAKNLYNKASKKAFGYGDGLDNDGDGKIDEDPENNIDDDGDGESGSPLNGLIDGKDNDGDGQVDEEDEGKYGIYKVADGIDNNNNGIIDEGIDEDNGDPYLKIDNDQDGKIDEDSDKMNDADKDGKSDEDGTGDANNDGCPGICLVDDDGDQLDLDGDHFPDGAEREAKTDERDPFDYPNIGILFGFFKIPQFFPDPNRDNPNYQKPARKNWVDEYPSTSDRNCYDNAGKFHPEWDDDEDGRCDEDGTADNDNDKDGKTDEDPPASGEILPENSFDKLPDIAAQRVMNNYLAEFPELLTKYIGQINRVTAFSGRWNNSKTGNIEDFSSLIGKRDAANRLYFLLANSALERVIDSVVEKTQAKIPIVVSGKISTAEVTINQNGKEQNLPVMNLKIDFFSGNNDRINGISYDSISNPLECSLFRGTSSKVATGSKLVLFNKIYNPVPPKNPEGKPIEENDGEYGWCLGKYYSSPEVCVPEEASKQILDFAGAREELPTDYWFESFTDYRACFDLKEKINFLKLTKENSDLSIGGRTIKSILRYREIVKTNMDKSKELQECLNNNKDNTSACSTIVVPALPKPENRPGFLDRYKPLNEIIVYKDKSSNPFTITLADIAKALKINERDFISLNEKLFNTGDATKKSKEVIINKPLAGNNQVLRIKLLIDNIEYAKKGGFLFIGGSPVEIPTLVKHKAPFSHEGKQTLPAYDVDWVLTKQSEAVTSQSLPIDNPRYLTFNDKKGEVQKIIYPNFFDTKSVEQARKSVTDLANKIANLSGDPLDAQKITSVFEKFVESPANLDLNAEISQLISENVVDATNETELRNLAGDAHGSLAEHISWKAKNIDEKHQYVARVYLSVKDDLKKNQSWKRLPAQNQFNGQKLTVAEALETNRSLVLQAVPFASAKGFEAAYLVLNGVNDQIEYHINPDVPENDEDQALKFPQKAILPTPPAVSPAIDETQPILLFLWFQHIIEWLQSLKFEASVTLRCQYEGSELIDEIARQFEQEQGKKELTDPDGERIFNAATKPADLNKDGIPDVALNTSMLEISADRKIILANNSDTTKIIVTGLDSNKKRNFQDGFSNIELRIVNGSENISVISDNPMPLSGGRAEFIVAGTNSVGAATLMAISKNRNPAVSSSNLMIQTTDRRLKLTTFNKVSSAENESGRPTQTLKDALILDENEKPLARIRSLSGQLEILDSNYEFVAGPSVKNEPLRVYLLNKVNSARIAIIYYIPFASELHKYEGMFPNLNTPLKGVNYRLLNSDNHKTEASESSIKFFFEDKLKVELTAEGQLFLDPTYSLRTTENLNNSQYQSFTVRDALGKDILESIIVSDFENIQLIDRQDLVDKLLSNKGNEAVGPIFGPGVPVTSEKKDQLSSHSDLEFFSTVRAAEKIIDFDGDGLSDFEEFIIGTNIEVADTDGDGNSDRDEVFGNQNPLVREQFLFSDLKTGDAEFASVIDLYLKGILRGYPDGTFRPQQIMTREEFIKVDLSSACVDCTRFSEAVKKQVADRYLSAAFPDKNITENLKMCVAEGKNRGIVSGYKGGENDGFFLPARSISRAEATKVILLTVGLEIPNNSLDSRPWYYNYIIGAKQASLYPPNIFDEIDNLGVNDFKVWFGNQINSEGNFINWLNGPITRGEFAVMVTNVFKIKNCYFQDSDSDGLSDSSELNQYGTDPYNPDTDNGGINDYFEVINNLDPLNPTDDRTQIRGEKDSDGDGLTDREEITIGSDPNKKDTDDGGINDFDEVRIFFSNPLDSADDNSLDSDDDGLSDLEELRLSTDPVKPDTDNGGVNDYDEVKIFKSDPLNAADDRPLGISSISKGFIAGSYFIRYEAVQLPGDYEFDNLAEELNYLDEIPADGKSELFVRAEVQNLLGQTIADDNGTGITFRTLSGSENFAAISGGAVVQSVFGRADTKIKANTKAGNYQITAEAVNEAMSAGEATVYVFAGTPESIVFESQSNQLKADSLARQSFTLKLLDRFGNIADFSTYDVTLKIEGPGVIEDLVDLDMTKEGINFSVLGGKQEFKVRTTTQSGEIKLTAKLNNSEADRDIIGSATINTYSDLKLDLSAETPIMTADGKSVTAINVSALDKDNNLLSTFSGPVNLELGIVGFGSLTSTGLNLVNGKASTQFTAGTKSGELTIIALSELLSPARTKITLEAPLLPSGLNVFSDAIKVAANPDNRVMISVQILDQNRNVLEKLTGGKVQIASTQATKQFVSFPNGNEAEIKKGIATFVIAPTSLTGPINLVLSFEKLPKATVQLQSVNRLTSRDFYENPPAIFHISLLGTDAGAFYRTDYLAGSMVFGSGKTEAATSLLAQPIKFETAVKIFGDGKVEALNEGKLEMLIDNSDSHGPALNFIDPESRALKATLHTQFDDKSLLDTIADDNFSTRSSGVYVKILGENFIVRKNTELITIAGAGGALVSIDKKGVITKMAKGLTITYIPERAAFSVVSAVEGRIAEIFYYFPSAGLQIIDKNADLNGKSGRFLTLSQDLSPLTTEPIFSGNSIRSQSGYSLVDSRFPENSFNSPGTGAISLEDTATKEGVGFGEGNKHMLLLAAGRIIGEANKPYASEIGVVIGDPTLSFNTPNQPSKTGYTQDIGVQLLAGGESIMSMTEMDYNNDGLPDIFAAYESGSVVLLENQISFNRFKNRGPILHLTNGIKILQKGDLDKDGFEDLIIVTENSCIQGEICVYWYKNQNGNFEPINLGLNSSQNISDLQVADMNSDGFPDLVISDFDNRIMIFYSDRGKIIKTGQTIATLDLNIDETAELVRGVAVRYEGMPVRNDTVPTAGLNYLDLPLSLVATAKSNSTEAKAFNDIKPKENFKITQSPPTSSDLYTFIYADQSPSLKTSVKRAKDLNGTPLKDGDEIRYQIILKNSGSKPIHDLWLSDVIPGNSTLDKNSFRCVDCGSTALTVISTENEIRPVVIQGISLPAGATRTLEYSVKLTDNLPKYTIMVGNNLTPDYPRDNLPDILVKPENNTGGRILVYYSKQKNGDNTVTYERYLSTPQKAPIPQNIPLLGADGKPDFGANNTDGVPKNVAKQAQTITGDSDGDKIPDFIDFADGELKFDLSKISESVNKSLDLAAKNLEDTIRFLKCGGSCLPFPISVSWLSPGLFNLLGMPIAFDPGTPLIGAVIPSPPFVCFGQTCYASTIFRLYVSPTIPPANLGIGLCLGPYPGGQCWAFSIDLLKALNLCDAINKAIADALAEVDTAISSLSGNLVLMGGSGKNSGGGDSRDNSIGISNQNLGKFKVEIPKKMNYRISGFPKPLTDWFSKQLDEVVDKLTDLPDVYVILPDLIQAFKPQSDFKSPKNIRDILTWLNSIPILEIETKRVSLKVPIVSRSEIAAFEHDATQWVANIKNQIKINQANLRPKIIVSVQKLLGQIEHNISTVQEYKRLFKKIKDFRSIQSKYISQVICYIDAIHEMLVGWITKNEVRIKAWIKAIEDIKQKFTDWKLLIEVPMSYVESCDTCQSERFTLTELIAKIFVVIPTPPIIQLPKWPDIILNFSEIEAGLKIVWPEIEFQPVSLQLPKLPQIDLTSPRLNIAFDAGQAFPDIPLLPAPPEFPILPNLPPLPVIELPVLPRPPEIPGIHPSLKVGLKGIKIAFKILCLIKSGLIPTQESQLKTKFEQLAARNLDAVLPIDTAIKINWPNINYSYLDSLEIKGRLNFSANITVSPIYDEVKKFADLWNKNMDEGVKTINEKLDIFNQLMQGIFNIPGQALPRSLDLDLNKLFLLPQNDAKNRFAPLLAQTAGGGEACSTPNLENLDADSPTFALLSKYYTGSLNEISRVAETLNREYSNYPKSLESEGKTLSYIPADDPRLNRPYTEIAYSEEYFANAPALNNLTRLKNGLLTYARDFNENTLRLEGDDSLDSALAYFNRSEHKLTAALEPFRGGDVGGAVSAGSQTFSFELSETKSELKDLGQRMLLAQNSGVSEGASNSSQPAQNQAQLPQDSTSDSLFDQRIEGIYLYNQALNINERLIDYTGEVSKKSDIMDIDFDKDGDYDIVYSYGGDIYLKENFLKSSPNKYYSGNPTVGKISDQSFNIRSLNNFRVAAIGNRKIDLVWEQTAGAAGYEIAIYPSLQDVYLPTGQANQNIHVLPFPVDETGISLPTRFRVTNLGGRVKIDGARRVKMSSTRVAIASGNIIQALKDSSIIIDDETEAPLNISAGHYYLINPELFSDEEPDAYLNSGAAILIQPDQNILAQELPVDSLILPDEMLQIPAGEEVTLEYFGRRSPIIKGPAVLRFKNLEDVGRPEISLNMANGNYYSVIRSFNKEGDLSNASAVNLLAPQNCSDRTPPIANAGLSERQVPLFGTISIDASASFDADSPVTGYFWDLDPAKDSDGDGILNNDRDSFRDKNILVDSDFDGNPANDLSDPLLQLGPFRKIEKKQVVLNVLDEVRNVSQQIITISVIEPTLNLAINRDINGLSGKVNPPNVNIPVTLLRKRGQEPWTKIITASATKEGVFLTDPDGDYRIADFINKEVMVLKNAQNSEIATVNPINGSINLVDNNYTVEVLPAAEKLPTRIEIRDRAAKDLLKNDEVQGNKEPLHEAYAAIRRESGNEVDTGNRVFQQAPKVISTTYLIVDPNTDVKIADSSVVFDQNSTVKLVGVHVKPLAGNMNLKNIAGDDLLFGGGVSVEKDGKIAVRIQPDGNIYIYDPIFSLNLKKQIGEDDPLVINLLEKNNIMAEIFLDLDLTRRVSLETATNGIIARPVYKPENLDSRLDSDGDGMPDVFELLFGLDPASYLDRSLDADSDGLTNIEEFLNNTNPIKKDTDGDGISDKDELSAKTSPLNSKTQAFNDIPFNSELFNITGLLSSYGYVEGYKEGDKILFKPGQPISRAEFTKIMLKILCIEPRPDAYLKPDFFADVSLISPGDPWFFADTKEAGLRGLITGYLREAEAISGLFPFRPHQTITLAEAAKIILEALDKEQIISLRRIKAGEGEVWYAPFLLAATNLGQYIIDPKISLSESYIITESEAKNPAKQITRGDFAVMVSRVLAARNCYEDDNNLNSVPDGWEKMHKIDSLDGDLDGDGLSNGLEYKLRSNPNNPDTDGGGVRDGDEYYRGGNLLDPRDDRDGDRDGDGLLNYDEITKYKTDPNNPDTDGGGVYDGEEVYGGTNPLFAQDDFDRDLDGLTDVEEQSKHFTNPDNPDTDSGGIGDGVEVVRGTDPLDKKDDSSDPRVKLPQGVNFSLPQCVTCPCEVAVENKAHLLEGDQVMTVIYDELNQVIHARSNLVEIK